MKALHLVASSATLSEFNLTDVIMSAADEVAEAEVNVSLARSDAVIVRTDPAVVKLIVINVLRNAVDSVLEARASASDSQPSPAPEVQEDQGLADADAAPEVVVNWGTTDEDCWISVIDRGVGLPKSSNRMWDRWTTSKNKDQLWGTRTPTAHDLKLGLPRRTGSTESCPPPPWRGEHHTNSWLAAAASPPLA